nr:uncharacterized protein LOC112006122 [Quercus suber]XP_023925873.1 uncharacterized protein LOC112037295 [Quercus suber]
MSAALIREEAKKQLPVYYVSQAFQGFELKYPRIEKIVFTLIVASRKLRQYFQANPILVMTDRPIKKFMNKPEAVGRMDGFVNEVESWMIQTDDSSTQKKGGVGVVITNPDREVLKDGVQLKFVATNNKAEYEGILTGLRLGKALGAKNLLVLNNSKLVIRQIKGEYEAKEERMQKYLNLTKHLAQEFDKVEFVQIPRSRNMEVDEISKITSSEEQATDIGLMLEDGHLPQNANEARKVKKRAARFTILNDTLYKRGFSMPYLKCVDEEEAKYILAEIHEEICRDHAGLRSLRLPAEKLMTIISPWPFAQWGIDIVGPLPLGKGKVKFLLIAIDYFTKWVEVEALATITEARIRGFVWKNIICKFEIPRTIISDNGQQFDSQGFKDFCSDLGIKNQFSSLGHPQAKG